METARQKILNYITEQQVATVEELSRIFHVTPANIRHHLSVLVDQGSVTIVGSKPAALRGRPSQVYAATRQDRQNNLETLADILLSDLEQSSTGSDHAPELKRIASRMASKYKIDTSNPTRRLYSSIRILNQMNYRAHWEAHVENPHIILDHCPYKSLIENHPEVCQLDRYILESMISTPVELIEKGNPNKKGLPQCVFIVKRPA